MEWSVFWTALATSIGGTAALFGVAVWLGKTWLKKRIEADAQHVYDTKLADYKAGLDRENEVFRQGLAATYQDAVDEKAADKGLFRELLIALPEDGVVKFLRDHDMGNSFDKSLLDPLEEFKNRWRGPTKAFLDSEIEEGKEELLASVVSFLRSCVHILFSRDDDHEQLEVPKYLTNGDYREGRDAEIGELNNASTTVVEKYSSLVVVGRKKLKI